MFWIYLIGGIVVFLALWSVIANSKQLSIIFSIFGLMFIVLIIYVVYITISNRQTSDCQKYVESISIDYGDKIAVTKPSIVAFDDQFAYLQKGQTYWAGKQGELISWPVGCEFFVFNSFSALEAGGFIQRDDPFFIIKGKLLISQPAITPAPVE